MSEVDNDQKTTLGLEPKIESTLCYVALWVSGLVFLLLEKDNKNVRFHAWQSIILFGGLAIIGMVMRYIPIISLFGWVVSLATFVMWVVLLIKTYQGEKFVVPIVGEIAENQNNTTNI